MSITYLRHMTDMKDGTADVQREILDREARAGYFWSFAPAVIPGKYQTEAYARTRLVEAHARLGIPGDVEETVAVRMERASLIKDPTRVFRAVICESVLYGATADPQVMVEQLLHLAALSRRPNVELGIVGEGVRVPTPLNHFDIVEDVLSVETTAVTYVITGEEPEFGVHLRMYEEFAAAAAFGAPAEEMIASAVEAIREREE